MSAVTIIGAGLAGLAAAQRCQQHGMNYTIVDKNSYRGGHAHSHAIDGFLFDEGPHISFTQDDIIKQLFADAVSHDYSEQSLKIANYWQGRWLKHPLLCHLQGLPDALIKKIITEAEQRTDSEVSNFKQWSYTHQGKTFSDEFTLPYTKKYWAIDAEQLTTDWLAPRFYTPSLAEIKAGAKKEQNQNYHYIKTFRYPSNGGFAAYTHAFAIDTPVQFDHQVTDINVGAKMIRFSNNSSESYEHLISSMPLPELIDCISDAPDDIKQAAKQLHCTAVQLINIGFNSTRELPDVHLIYVYDPDICFARAHFPHKLAKSMTPDGQYSLQLEVYHSAFNPLVQEDMTEQAIADCYRCGLLHPDDQILVKKCIDVDYANVLFTHKRQQAVDKILSFLEQQQISCCGRYGLWAYYWSDDSIRSGWQTADNLRAS